MGIFDSVFSTFDNAISDVFGTSSGSFLGGSSANSSSFLPVNYGYPTSYEQPQPQVYNVQAPMVIQGGMAVARSLATRFPALAAALSALGSQFGKAFTPEMVWRMLKQNGPALVGGLIGGAAMNELAVWKTTHKGRRMNVANTKALRRSVRRLKGFDRLSHRVSAQLSRVGGSRRRSSSRRCGTCRKSPCSC
jgi:hypothetical protein